MLDISTHYDKTVSTERLANLAGGSSWEGYSVNLAAISCLIQPLDDAPSEDLDNSMGMNYSMFCDVVDIEIGDEIIEATTLVRYRVVGRRRFDVFGSPHHLELTIRKYND